MAVAKKITLWPHGGSGNHGCEAIVRSTAAILGAGTGTGAIDPATLGTLDPAIPGTLGAAAPGTLDPAIPGALDPAALRLFSAAPAEDVRYGLDAICRVSGDTAPIRRFSPGWIAARLSRAPEAYDELAFAPLLRAARHSDTVLSIGGDNYCYGVNNHMITVNRAVRRAGIPTVLWGCSVSPEALAEPVVRDDLAGFSLIVARESITFGALRAAGLGRVVLRPDPAFAMPRTQGPLPEGFGAQGAGEGTVGINLSPMVIAHQARPGAVMAAYERLIGHIVGHTKMSVALIPHVVWAHNDDREPLRNLHAKFAATGRVTMLPDAPAPELKGAIGRCRFMVAARTHASIAAYSSGVPTIVAGYSVKARGIARDIFGSEAGHVIAVQSLRNGDELVEAFETMRRNEERIRARYAAVMPGMIAAAETAGQEITSL